MLRACFITPGAYPVPSPRGGSVERVVEKMVPELVPTIEATIYARQTIHQKRHGHLLGVPIFRFPAGNKERYFQAVVLSLKQRPMDIIQVENRPLWIPRLKKRFFSRRIGLNLQSVTFISPPHLNSKTCLHCLRKADYIQVNSTFLRDYLGMRFPNINHKIFMNPLGVDLTQFAVRDCPETLSWKEKFLALKGWTGRRIVLYVGRLIRQKGVHCLLKAWPKIVQQFPDALLLIVGSAFYGSYRQTKYVHYLKRLARTCKQNVVFQPYVSYEQIPTWYAIAELAVVPSIGKEAFGLVNVEAMAAELPVIATCSGGIPDIVVDGKTGYLVSNETQAMQTQLVERICLLLNEQQTRCDFGKQGRQRVAEFYLWQHTASRWLQFQQSKE